jgi:hypothetical protein
LQFHSAYLFLFPSSSICICVCVCVCVCFGLSRVQMLVQFTSSIRLISKAVLLGGKNSQFRYNRASNV